MNRPVLPASAQPYYRPASAGATDVELRDAVRFVLVLAPVAVGLAAGAALPLWLR